MSEAPLKGSYIFRTKSPILGAKVTVQREVKLRLPGADNWIVGVEYTPWDEPTEHFVIEKEEFLTYLEPYYPIVKTYKNAVCKGSYMLGTACGRCERCEDNRPISRS